MYWDVFIPSHVMQIIGFFWPSVQRAPFPQGFVLLNVSEASLSVEMFLLGVALLTMNDNYVGSNVKKQLQL